MHTSNRLGRTTLARGDHDKKLHDAVIDLAAATLQDVDILVTDGDADVDAGLTVGKFAQVGFGGRGTQALADGICEAGMRSPREDLHAPHGSSMFGWKKKRKKNGRKSWEKQSARAVCADCRMPHALSLSSSLQPLPRSTSRMSQFPEIQGGGSLILAWQVKSKHVVVIGGGEVSPCSLRS